MSTQPSEKPYAQWTVREGRDHYLRENGFSMDGYTAPTFSFEVFGKTFTFRNSENRKKAIPLHDLHHVLTGYGTNIIGEAEVGVFELRGGCTSLVTYWLNGSAALLGLFLAPRRMWRAFVRSKGVKTLYTKQIDYEAILAMTIEEARAFLGIPQEGAAEAKAVLHKNAPRPA